MELRKYLLLGLISVILFSSCSILNTEESIVKVAPLQKIKNQFEPYEAWSVVVGKGNASFHSHLHPACQDGTVYVADRFGLVEALDGKNGKRKWKISLSSDNNNFSSREKSALLSGGITVSGQYIYIGSEHAKVYALNSTDGTIVWQSQVAGEALSQPVVSNDIVLIHTSNGMLQGLDKRSGLIKWTTNLDISSVLSLRGKSAPAIAFGSAIVGSDNGYVSAIVLNQGQIIWQQRISQSNGVTEIDRLSDVDITPVIINGIVYALAYNGNLVALDLWSGQILWKHKIGSVKNFFVDTNQIYLVDQDDYTMAISTNDGVITWRQSALLHRNLTSPVLYNGYIVVGDSEGYLHWLNIVNGHFVAQKKLDSSGFQTDPVVADDKLFIQAKNGKVYAIIC